MRNRKQALQFGTMDVVDVPKFREGKHKRIITLILYELSELKPGSAIKVPLAALGDTTANVRSALNRAARKAGRRVVTAADESFLYIWNVPAGAKVQTP
jgi:hypothetical protein